MDNLVYVIIWNGAGYEKDFVGVFSTYEKADEWVQSRKYYSEYEILYCELDKVFKEV